MSIYHLRSCFSKEMSNIILEQLSQKSNQIFIEKNIVEPILNRVYDKVRGIIISIGILLSLLILLNTLIIIQYVMKRKNA